MPPRRRSGAARSRSPSAAASPTPAAATAETLRRQLYLILALRCLRTASFAQPVLVVWFAEVGLTAAQVLWLGSFYSALVILAEVPSGLISDRLGRRRTLHWAFLALGASLAAAALADRAAWLLGASQVLKAVGSALFSGTDMALLYETLKRYKSAGEVKEQVLAVESMHVFAVAVTEAVFATLGGLLADTYGLQPTVALSALPFLGSATLALLLEDDSKKPEPPGAVAAAVQQQRSPGGTPAAAERRAKPPAAAEGRSSWLPPPGLGRLFVGGVAVNCGTYVAATALNPLLWSGAGIATLHFGWLSACNNIVSAGSALLAPPLRRLATATTNGVGVASGGSSEVVCMERLLVLLLALAACAYTLLALAASAPVAVAAAAPEAATWGGLGVDLQVSPHTAHPPHPK